MGIVNDFTVGVCKISHDLNDVSSSIQGELTQQQKNIFNLITSENGAFENKLASGISQAQTKISDSLTQFDTWIATPPSGWTSPEIQELKDATVELQTSVGSFLNHTNITSGVNLSPTGAGDMPSLATIMSVGHQSVALNHWLDKVTNNPCGSLLNMFSSNLCGGGIMDGVNELFQDIVGLIEDASTTKEILLGKIQEFKNNLDNSVLFDKNTFNGLVADLERAALAQMMGDFYNHPCGRWILQNSIGKYTLLEELQK